MGIFAISATILFVSTYFCAGRASPRSQAESDLHRCTPKIINRASPRELPEIHFRKGERYKNIPIIAYQVMESGQVAQVLVKRSSGVADIDKYALDSVRELKFNKRSGCPVVDSQAGITVDFR